MSREIPEVVRAAAGLAATVLDEARKLPETLPGLPVRVIGLAMQQAMKVQQTYAGLVARGDELLVGLRGEGEPGLATFDDDDAEPVTGFRGSAFDRADGITDDEVADLPDDPAADAVVAAVDDLSRELVEDLADGAEALADGADRAQGVLADVPEDAISTEEVLEALAIDEVVPEVAETDPLEETSGDVTAADDAVVTEDAGALERALLESEPAPAAATIEEQTDEQADGAETVDVLTPDGEVATVDAAVTDEGIAAVEQPQEDTGTDETVAATDGTATAATATDAGPEVAVDESGSPVAAATGTPTDGGDAGTGGAPVGDPPVDGYDDFSIAQLRGRLRGYQLSTVSDLLAYEQATRARDPYLRMLRNRLEKLEEQAVESSPLAPRGT
ncbi:hypothetical protein ACI79P_01605 [Blastococcus sp. SYSU DS0510]